MKFSRTIICLFISCITSNLLPYSLGSCVVSDSNRELVEYICEGGTVADLQEIPDNVEKLRVTKMPIEQVTSKTFSRFGRSLLVLSCSHCSISTIDDDAFRSLENLQQLSLDNNRLKEVKASWFQGLSYLTYLDLNYNQIERIDGDVFRQCPDLVDLRLSGNQLECLDLEAMSKLHELKRIFLNDNPRFACPNALKRFLDERGVDYERDPLWDNIPMDRIFVSEPPRSFKPTDATPRYYSSRGRWPVTESPYATTFGSTDPYGYDRRTPPRPPTPPEMINPSVPGQDFPMQGPYYDPKVTQQQIDQYRQRFNATTGIHNGTTVSVTTSRTSVAMVREKTPTTTECPSSAARFASELIMLSAVFVAVGLFQRHW